MSKKFIMALTEHNIMGVLLKPYLVEQSDDNSYLIVNNIIAEEIDANKYTDKQNELIKWSLQCSDKDVWKVFSKKKTSVVNFFSKLKKDEKNQKYVKDYIEKRLLKCFNILRNSDIELFFASNSDTISMLDKIIIEKDQPQAVFNFIKDEFGIKYYLTIKHKGEYLSLFEKNFTIINNSPCVIIIENVAYYFDLDEEFKAKKLLPFFTKKHIAIPKRIEKQYFSTFVKNSVQNFDVLAKGFAIEVLKPKPKAVISIEKDWRNDFAMIVKFDYLGNEISASNSIKSFVSLDDTIDNQVFTKIERDYEFEQAKLSILNKFTELDENINSVYRISKAQSEQGISMMEWLNNNSESLIKAGFHLKQDFYKKEYFIYKISIDLNLKESKDWFDLYGKVYFGNIEMPFIALKSNLLNGIKEFLLPNNKIAILPDEWFEKYAIVFQIADVNKDKLQIKKIHTHFVQKELESINNALVKKANKLKQLKPLLSKNIKAQLRDYQQVGYQWMYSLCAVNFGACLADDMGLGKTVQTLALICKILEDKQETVETPKDKHIQLSLFDDMLADKIVSTQNQNAGIIVMPKSLIHNWANEINKFAPHLKFLKYIEQNRTKNITNFNNYDIILTTYGLLRNDIDLLSDYYYKFIILDESQYIKNPESKVYKAVSKIGAEFKMILTGTPIENSLNDLWAQINFINPGLLGNLQFFNEEFVKPIVKGKDDELRLLKQKKLQKLINPFILRRRKTEVLDDLPDLTETNIYCSMNSEQKRIYDIEKSKIRNSLLENIEKKNVKDYNVNVLRGLLRLRQLANHPKLLSVSGDEEMEYTDYISSDKYDEIIRTIENLVAASNKVLIFSSFVKHLDLYEDYFKEQKWKYAKLTGQTKDREKEISKFNDDNDNLLFLISLKAGGVGLNLTSANYVLFLDPWWNPAVENQAISRAHRMGQKNKVMVYRFITENSIEQKIMKLQESKQELADTFVNNNNPFKKLSQQEILGLFED